MVLVVVVGGLQTEKNHAGLYSFLTDFIPNTVRQDADIFFPKMGLSRPLKSDCVHNRDAVVAVDRHTGQESDEFQPQKRTKLYGIATAYAQCPSGKYAMVLCKLEKKFQHFCMKSHRKSQEEYKPGYI